MINQETKRTAPAAGKSSHAYRISKDFALNRTIYLMALPILAYYIIFNYIPMYGAIIAFKDFSPARGIIGSNWVGFEHFMSFFNSVYFWRVVRNTILINVYQLMFGFPAPIILALLLNEIRNTTFKRTVQTVTYLPHFISIMVISGMIISFTSSTGFMNDIIEWMGGRRTTMLLKPELFRTIFVSSGVWQNTGWGTIIYLAALTGINPELYQSAIIDGAGRWKQIRHITIPGILPTVLILFILRMGQMMNVGYEKIILLYNPVIYETADVISSFVYRKGLLEFSYSYSTAVGLFNSLINLTLLIAANWTSRRLNETSLW